MKLKIAIYALVISFCNIYGVPLLAQDASTDHKVVKPILLDARAMSGLDLKPVKNASQPDRRLFQKNLYRGKSISVYIVSSETADVHQSDYGIDEFIYVINGRARLEPDRGVEQIYTPGEFFMVPKGFAGVWETQGGTEYYHELSVISTGRSNANTSELKAIPLAIDKTKLAGINLTKIDEATYFDNLYSGPELTVNLKSEPAGSRIIETPLPEQLIYIIAGSLSLTPQGGLSETFYSGDFVLLPANFTGTWECDGHHLFRSLQILENNN